MSAQPSPGEEFAGILLMLLGAAFLLALVNGGWTGPGGVTDLISAKFAGRVRNASPPPPPYGGASGPTVQIPNAPQLNAILNSSKAHPLILNGKPLR